MNTSKIVALFIAVFALGSFGCAGEAIVGTWEGKGADSRPNRMQVDDDLKGDSTLYFYANGDLYHADFDVDATARGDSYDVDFSCQGDCHELDFTMKCDVRGDDDELKCTGDNGWESYVFAWDKLSD